MTLLQQIIEPSLRPTPNLYEEWMLIVFYTSFSILAYVRVVYQKRLELLWNSLLRFQIVRQLMREELVFSHRASVFLVFIFFLNAGLLLYQIDRIYNWDFFNVQKGALYLIYVGIVIAIYGGKALIINIFRLIFNDKNLLREYLYEVFLVNKALGLMLFPALLLLTFLNSEYSGITLFIILGVIMLFFIYRTIRGLQIAFSYNVSRLYIILYLCTLEILPLLLIYRVLFFREAL